MKKVTVGILAHVDAGKTTFSEALLYHCGSIASVGRVDHQSAFLDHHNLEKQRGITIFSKQAILEYQDISITLLDTPGHMDFSTEMERCLQVLDYAILLISASSGVQSHTRTLWRLLEHYEIPTFLFVNKMDLPGVDQSAILHTLKEQLSDTCTSFDQPKNSAFWEEVSLCDEAVLSDFLECGIVEDAQIAALVQRRQLFPCFFGSALKLEGVDSFLDGFSSYITQPNYPSSFGARVFKVARDAQGTRLTYLKLTGGTLSVKDLLKTNRNDPEVPGEKVDQIRLYSGEKYQTVPCVSAGSVCAVTGLRATHPGQGLGYEPALFATELAPVMRYRVLLPPGQDPFLALQSLQQLEEEDPQLHLLWQEREKEIYVQLMGNIQLEILQKLILERFDLPITFDVGSILYKETIKEAVEGVGHFEPLRHYAEVHLLLEPLSPGSGLHFDSSCGEDELSRSWQRLILSHLQQKEHLGVLTGSPITDMKITLAAGRAHQVHTEGGDFREATWRAMRQGLMCAKSLLLEPWYSFHIQLPTESVGRAMTDLQQMGGQFTAPEAQGAFSFLQGSAPVSTMGNYAAELGAYTQGQGQLSLSPGGYHPCPEQEQVIVKLGYESLHDIQNPSGSVFCSHGAGFVVPWDQVKDHMHLPSVLTVAPVDVVSTRRAAPAPPRTSIEQDKELMAIYERTYGPIKRHDFLPQATVKSRQRTEGAPPYQPPAPEYLLVDGYNIIHSWDELKTLAQDNLDSARKRLMDMLSNYQAMKHCHVILVFDAYKVPGGLGSVSKYHNIHIVYTKEAETADSYIEKATYDLGKKYRVRVATSDSTEQLIILGHGALRVSARAFHEELKQVNQQLQGIMRDLNHRGRSREMEQAMKAALEGQVLDEADH